jgi:hypothetical protein
VPQTKVFTDFPTMDGRPQHLAMRHIRIASDPHAEGLRRVPPHQSWSRERGRSFSSEVFCIDQTGARTHDIVDSEMQFNLSRSGTHMSNRSKAPSLVIDDDPRIRESLGMLLIFAGYDVAAAVNGASALLHLNRVLPNLIVTDTSTCRTCQESN